MYTNVAQLLNQTVKKFPNKYAFIDSKRKLTFEELHNESSHIAQELIKIGAKRKPVVIYLDKSVEVICAFLGVIKSGNFYSPIDVDMPVSRIDKIIQTLEPEIIITDKRHIETANKFSGATKVVLYEECMTCEIDTSSLEDVENSIIDTDLIYVLFTSGSTGVPKGVMVSQRGVLDFVEWATEYLEVDDTFVFGNQTPFYFSFSIYDIYLTIKNGATAYIIPKEYFSYPGELMKYLYDNSINTIVWVPSALSMISVFRALRNPYLPELKRVMFGAESMPVKQLNKWMKEYPEVKFYNLYGPTEVTDTCSAYKVLRALKETEVVPIGQACTNKEMFLLNDKDEIVQDGEIGELCVRGSGLGYGYYNDKENTAKVFVQNPLNKNYNEIIYRTGDLAKYNEFGELVYVSRKDYQIKHMGHRIELGEIDTLVLSIEDVEQACCLYDSNKSKIVLFYMGNVEEQDLFNILKENLNSYMIPNKIISLDVFPMNLNGKIDRAKLKKDYMGE